MAQEMSIARIVDTVRGAMATRRERHYALAVREPRPLKQVIVAPPHMESVYERDVRETGCFAMEGEVTAWNFQPGTQTARLDLQDPQMNATMQGSGQTNINLNIPVDVANYIPPRSRLRITIEVL